MNIKSIFKSLFNTNSKPVVKPLSDILSGFQKNIEDLRRLREQNNEVVAENEEEIGILDEQKVNLQKDNVNINAENQRVTRIEENLLKLIA